MSSQTPKSGMRTQRVSQAFRCKQVSMFIPAPLAFKTRASAYNLKMSGQAIRYRKLGREATSHKIKDQEKSVELPPTKKLFFGSDGVYYTSYDKPDLLSSVQKEQRGIKNRNLSLFGVGLTSVLIPFIISNQMDMPVDQNLISKPIIAIEKRLESRFDAKPNIDKKYKPFFAQAHMAQNRQHNIAPENETLKVKPKHESYLMRVYRETNIQ